MYTRTLILLTILQMLSSVKGSDLSTDEKKVICYYGGLTIKEISNLYPEDIDASMCTHIVYMHGEINNEVEEVNIKPLLDVNMGGARYTQRLVKLKEANPNLKLLLFVSPENVTWIRETEERSAKIIQSAIKLLNATRFDGLDFVKSPREDEMEDYATFFCDMKAEFDKYGYIVSSLAINHLESKALDPVIERMSRCSSFINLLLENWTTRINATRIFAPISQTKALVDAYIERGFPANKLVIAIPSFGRIVTLTDPEKTGLGADVSGAGNDDMEAMDGYTIFYGQLVKRLNDTDEGWTINREEESNSPYAYSKAGKWVSYEDGISAATKARYVLEKNLGGATIFSLEMDDFQGVSGKTFPIIRAVSDTFKKGARASNVNP